MIAFWHTWPDGTEHRLYADGMLCVTDLKRGIGLVVDKPNQGWWLVTAMFLRTDIGVSEPHTIRYGMN